MYGNENYEHSLTHQTQLKEFTLKMYPANVKRKRQKIVYFSDVYDNENVLIQSQIFAYCLLCARSSCSQ